MYVTLSIYWLWLCHICFFATVVENNPIPIPMTVPDPRGDVEESIHEADVELYRRVQEK